MAEDKPKMSKWLIFSLVVMAVAAACVVYVLWPSSPPVPVQGTAAPVITAQQSPAAPATPPASAYSPCTEYPDALSLDVIPADVRWELNTASANPVSDTFGPQITTAGIASCFARTPAGALLSATNFVAELASPTINKGALYDQRLAHTVGYDTLAGKVANAPGDSGDLPAAVWQISAFRFQSYSDTHAVLWVATRNTQGQATGTLVASLYVLTWESGDWKIVPPLDGGNLPTFQIPELSDTFVHFAGA